MIRLGILPKIDGIYAKCLVDTTAMFENDKVEDKVPVDEAPDYWTLDNVCACDSENPAVDGVFVSHAHFDHIQDISFLDPKIPIYSTGITKILAKAITDVSNFHVDDQFYWLKRESVITQKSEHYKTLCPGECEYSDIKEEEKPEIYDPKAKFKFTHEFTPKHRKFETPVEGQIKGIKYKMIPVGHSIPGACSVLLTLPSDGKRILYTGDLRFTGENDISIDDYVQEVGGKVDVIITEGTRIDN